MRVLGHSNEEPVEIFSTDCQVIPFQECMDWLNNYTRRGDWGGYDYFTIVDDDDHVMFQLERDNDTIH